MWRASISVLLMLLMGGMVAFAAAFTLVPGAPQPGEMPCGGHHSCCVSPSPSSAPALPSTLNWHRSPITCTHSAFPRTHLGPRSRMAYTVDVRSLPSCSAFSSVLRI